jgi:hypothetical protein
MIRPLRKLRLAGFALALVASLSLVGHAARHQAHPANASHCSVCLQASVPTATSLLVEIPKLIVSASLAAEPRPGYRSKSTCLDSSRGPPAL